MERLNLKQTHKAVQNYYEALCEFKAIGVSHEGAVRSAFQTLLEHCGRQFGWKLVPEWSIKKDNARSIRVDGALVDEYRLTHGFWEAKDTADDLAKEVKKKLKASYPQNNIIFQAPERAILLHNGRVVLDEDITEPVVLVEILKRFFEYTPPEFEEWTDAVAHFQERVPELGKVLKELIEEEVDGAGRLVTTSNPSIKLKSTHPALLSDALGGGSGCIHSPAGEKIIHRITKALGADSILCRRDAKYFFIIAEKTTRPTTAKRFLLTKAAELKLTDTIYRSSMPRMQPTKMQAVNSLRAFRFLLIPLHSSPLSGSATAVALP